MNRPQPLRRSPTRTSLLATQTVVEEVLPEHVLLHLLQAGQVAHDASGEAQSHALELAAAIAAARALIQGDSDVDPEALANVASHDPGFFDFDDLAAELGGTESTPAPPEDEEDNLMNDVKADEALPAAGDGDLEGTIEAIEQSVDELLQTVEDHANDQADNQPDDAEPELDTAEVDACDEAQAEPQPPEGGDADDGLMPTESAADEAEEEEELPSALDDADAPAVADVADEHDDPVVADDVEHPANDEPSFDDPETASSAGDTGEPAETTDGEAVAGVPDEDEANPDEADPDALAEQAEQPADVTASPHDEDEPEGHAADDAASAAESGGEPIASAGGAPPESGELAQAALDRLEAFLAQLQTTLADRAQSQPSAPEAPAPNIDIEPLVQSVQAGFERVGELSAQTAAAVTALGEQLTVVGDKIEGGLSQGITAIARQANAPTPATSQPTCAATVAADPRTGRQGLVLGAVALLVFGWSIVFYLKTGSLRLALGTLIGANLIACCMLLARRDRG